MVRIWTRALDFITDAGALLGISRDVEDGRLTPEQAGKAVVDVSRQPHRPAAAEPRITEHTRAA